MSENADKNIKGRGDAVSSKIKVTGVPDRRE